MYILVSFERMGNVGGERPMSTSSSLGERKGTSTSTSSGARSSRVLSGGPLQPWRPRRLRRLGRVFDDPTLSGEGARGDPGGGDFGGEGLIDFELDAYEQHSRPSHANPNALFG